VTLLCAARCRAETAREAAPGYRLCWGCRTSLARNLAALHDLAPDLEAALSRANTVGEKVAGSPGRVSELNEHAAAVRWQIHHDMVTTVRLVMTERGLHLAPAAEIGVMAHWLGVHTDWLSAHGSAGERANEAADWVSAARAAINPNPPKRVPIGPCPIVDCPGILSAVVRPQDSLLPSTITCSWWQQLSDDTRTRLLEDGAEPHAWTSSSWHALGRRMRSAA
jgi:hypothetical protein